MVDLVRTAAAQMAGQQTMAPLPKPEAPLLRETTSPFAINWMGAAVGRSYDVERAASPTGPWTVVGRDISDGVNEWNPETMVLFRDDYRQLQLGHTYYYRVTAKNESGRSAPSNVISVQHSEENQPPVVTLEPALTTTQDQGVETGLEIDQHGVTGLAGGVGALLVSGAKLLLRDAILSAKTLLFAQTHCVIGLSATAGAAVLTRSIRALFEDALSLRGQSDAEGAGKAHLTARTLNFRHWFNPLFVLSLSERSAHRFPICAEPASPVLLRACARTT